MTSLLVSVFPLKPVNRSAASHDAAVKGSSVITDAHTNLDNMKKIKFTSSFPLKGHWPNMLPFVLLPKNPAHFRPML